MWNLTQWIRLIFNEKQLRSTLAINLSIIQLNTCNSKSKKDRERERTPVFIVVHPFSSSLRATSTLLDEVQLHQSHPLCNKCWLKCLQEFLQIKALILQLLFKTNSPKLQVPLEFGAPWILGSLNYPCTPSISSLESSMRRPINKPPSTSTTVRKSPKSFGGVMRLFTSFEDLIKPNKSSCENQITIPTSTLKNLHTQRQSDSKKKCLILENVWAISFWDLERIDANDSIILEKRRGVYI